jgi:hypothetical protein
MKKLQTMTAVAGAALAIAAVACSHDERPANAPETGVPAYWESNVPREDNRPAPVIEDRDRMRTRTNGVMPPGGDSFDEHHKGSSDKFLWQDGVGPKPDSHPKIDDLIPPSAHEPTETLGGDGGAPQASPDRDLPRP